MSCWHSCQGLHIYTAIPLASSTCVMARCRQMRRQPAKFRTSPSPGRGACHPDSQYNTHTQHCCGCCCCCCCSGLRRPQGEPIAQQLKQPGRSCTSPSMPAPCTAPGGHQQGALKVALVCDVHALAVHKGASALVGCVHAGDPLALAACMQTTSACCQSVPSVVHSPMICTSSLRYTVWSGSGSIRAANG